MNAIRYGVSNLNVSCTQRGSWGNKLRDRTGNSGKPGARRSEVFSKPLIVKLSPNVTDIAELARAAVSGGADALSCINTLVGMKVDVHRRQPVIPRGTGGLSGPAIRPVGVAAVWKAAKAVGVPIIGLGGIASANDALEYLLAGASAVQVGTALFSEPDIPARVLAGIRDYLVREGFTKIADLHDFF